MVRFFAAGWGAHCARMFKQFVGGIRPMRLVVQDRTRRPSVYALRRRYSSEGSSYRQSPIVRPIHFSVPGQHATCLQEFIVRTCGERLENMRVQTMAGTSSVRFSVRVSEATLGRSLELALSVLPYVSIEKRCGHDDQADTASSDPEVQVCQIEPDATGMRRS